MLDHLAHAAHFAAGQVGLQDLDALLHGLGGDQHLRHENLVVLELLADHVHGGNHGVQNFGCGDALVQGLLHGGGHQLGLATGYQIVDILKAHSNITPFIITTSMVCQNMMVMGRRLASMSSCLKPNFSQLYLSMASQMPL